MIIRAVYKCNLLEFCPDTIYFRKTINQVKQKKGKLNEYKRKS